MKSRAEVRADYIKRKCNGKGVNVVCEAHSEPIEFISITNHKGDMASVSDNCATYESAIYTPEWSDYMIKWARLEGFSEDQIRKQNLIRKVGIEEAVDLLTS